jgi:hypothetical protein
MAKTVIFKSPVRFGGQRYPAGTEMELEDRVIKGLPADVYSVKAPEPVASTEPVVPVVPPDKGDKNTEKAKA